MNRERNLINRGIVYKRSEMAGAGGNQRRWRGGQGQCLYKNISILTDRKVILIATLFKKQPAKKHLYFEEQLYVIP